MSAGHPSLYHGSPVVIEDIALAAGTWLTKDIEVAKCYGKFVYRIEVPPEHAGLIEGPNWEGHYVTRGQIPFSCVTMVGRSGFLPLKGNHPEPLMTLEAFQKEMRDLNEWAQHGCLDGGCQISPPKSICTNGGCRCRPWYFSERLLWLAAEVDRYGRSGRWEKSTKK